MKKRLLIEDKGNWHNCQGIIGDNDNDIEPIWNPYDALREQADLLYDVDGILGFLQSAEFNKGAVNAVFRPRAGNFDKVWEHLNRVAFMENHEDLDIKFQGKLWVRELFMRAQNIVIAHRVPLNVQMILCMLYLVSYFVVDWLLFKYIDGMPQHLIYGADAPIEWSVRYWIFNAVLLVPNWLMLLLFLQFIEITFVDVERRH